LTDTDHPYCSLRSGLQKFPPRFPEPHPTGGRRIVSATSADPRVQVIDIM
jgi:hypothetical protein